MFQMSTKKKILVVEDEDSIRGFIVINLSRAGYDVYEADSGERALEMLAADSGIGVVLLDVMMPGMDGFEVCRKIRAKGSKVGIIMLTARTQEVDRVTGLMTGADDYVTKPFSPTELIARIDALYRRLEGVITEDSARMVSGPFELNTRNRTLDKNGERIRLTQVEYTIMRYFLENPDRAISREDMLTAVWGSEYLGELKIVDVNIRRLRIKIEDDAAAPRYIQTVWGYGYKWNS